MSDTDDIFYEADVSNLIVTFLEFLELAGKGFKSLLLSVSQLRYEKNIF